MILRPELPRHRAEDAGADRLFLIADQHCGVSVEADHRAVGPPDVLCGPHHHGLHHGPLLDATARDRLLDRHHDDVADMRIFPPGSAQDLDALNLAGAGIVGDVENCFYLDHGVVLDWLTPETLLPSGPASSA